MRVTVSQEGSTGFFDDGLGGNVEYTSWTWTKDADWIASTEASPQNGPSFFNNSTSFEYRVAENTTGGERIGTITFTTLAGDVVRTFVITQAGTLSLSETEHVNTSLAQYREITVFAAADVDWAWSSDAPWLKGIDEADGPEDEQQTGQQDFGYFVEENTSGVIRTGTITFFTTTGNNTATLTVTQLSSFGTGSGITLSDTEHANSAQAQARTVEVSSNLDWIWESDQSWLTATGEAETQSGIQTINGQDETDYDGNPENGIFDGGDGSGGNAYQVDDKITLSDGSIVTVDAVDGNGDVTEFTVDSTSSTGAVADIPLVQVALERAGEINPPGADNTFTLTPGANNVSQTSTFIYEVAANDTGATRTGTLTFRTLTGGFIATLTVTQVSGSGDYLTLSDSQHATGAQETTRTVDVFSNTEWTWTSDSDWLSSGEEVTQDGDRELIVAASANTPFSYQVAENDTGADRSGTLTFTTTSGGLIATLTVFQGNKLGNYLVLSDTTQATSFNTQEVSVNVFSDTDWRWESDSDWLTSNEQLNQSGDREFKAAANPGDDPVNTPFIYQVSVNDTGEARTGNLTFKTAAGDITAVLEVTQLGGTGLTLNLSENERFIGAAANGGLSNPENGQDETSYDHTLPNGTFAGGTLHAQGDIITLSDGTTVTVDAVGGGGVVTQFTVDSTNANFTTLAGATLAQASTTGTGRLDFSLTVQANNLANPLGLNVSSNTNWLWSSDQPWLTAPNEPQQQNGDQPFTYAVAANDTGAARTGTITFTSATGGLIATLDVTQLSEPGNSLSLSESVLITDFTAKDNLTVDVSSDTTWLWETSDDSWLTASTEDATQSGDRKLVPDTDPSDPPPEHTLCIRSGC